MEEQTRVKNLKKARLLVTISLILMFIAISSISYAVWYYTFTGNTNTLSTNDISLDYLESSSDIINIQNALPMSDSEGKNQTQTFNFAVTSKTTRNTRIDYTLSIEKLDVDDGYISLDDNDINLYLTDYNNNKLDTLCNDPSDDGVAYVNCLPDYELYSGSHNHDSSHEVVQDKFKLRVWLFKDVDVSDWDANTKLQYKFKINLSSTENI